MRNKGLALLGDFMTIWGIQEQILIAMNKKYEVRI